MSLFIGDEDGKLRHFLPPSIYVDKQFSTLISNKLVTD